MPEAVYESVTFADVEGAAARVAGRAHRTPVATSRTLDARLSCRLFFDTMRVVWERMKLVVEPTGLLGAAAALHAVVEVRDRRVGVILSGGNVELAKVGEWFRER